ncbi:MAG TPA: hypothetical protein VIJ84_03055 [Gaiellaceae bacterium]
MNRDPKQSGDQLDAFLKAGDPVEPSALSGDGIESALDEIGAEITGRSRQTSSRWTRRLSMSKPRAALLIGFATIGIGAAVAGGSQLGARTGIFQPTPQQIAKVAKASPEKAKRMQSDLNAGGPGEALNPAGSDFRAVALQVASDIPWPTGYESWRDFLISDEIRMSGGGSLESSGALHGWFAMSAFYAWVLAWRHAEIAGDTEAVARAAKVISEAPRWKAVTDEDKKDKPLTKNHHRSRRSPSSLFSWMLPYRDAVLAGDRARVKHLLVTGFYGGMPQIYDPAWRALEDDHPEWRTLAKYEQQQKYEQYLASRTS